MLPRLVRASRSAYSMTGVLGDDFFSVLLPESATMVADDMKLLLEQGSFPERIVSFPNGTHAMLSGTLAG